MTTPAQYEAAIRALEVSIAEEERYSAADDPDVAALKTALAIVREAAVVRDTVATRLDYWLAQYPEDVFPDVPITHGSEGAMIMRLMLPRIKADLLEALSAEGHACAGAVEPTPFTPDPQR